MKKKNIFSILIICTFFNICLSQESYLVNRDKEIFRINNDNSLTFITTVIDESAFVTDIAISSGNKFYGITTDSNIILIDIADGSTSEVFSGLSSSGSAISLVCSNEDILYSLLGPHIYSFDLSTGNVEFVYNVGYETPGDLTFYKGNLIFQSGWPGTIKAYNLDNNDVVNIFCLPDVSGGSYFGITNVSNSCEDNLAICNANNGIYEIDFENNLFQELSIDLEGMIVNGLASNNENLSSLCNIQLEEVDCNLSIEEIEWLSSSKIIYPNPVGNMMKINSNITQLTFEIYSLNGQLILRNKTKDKSIKVEELNSGLYLVKIISAFGTKIEKMIKY